MVPVAEPAPRKVVGIIPAANEERYVGHAVRLLRKELDRGVLAHLIVVDDGSRDRTRQRAALAADGDPRITILSHEENRGKAAAVMTGIRHAKEKLGGHIAVLVDADTHAYAPGSVQKIADALKEDPRLNMCIARIKEGNEIHGISGSKRWSGARALRISAFQPYFAGRPLWRRQLEESRFGFEAALNGFFANASRVEHDALFEQRPAFHRDTDQMRERQRIGRTYREAHRQEEQADAAERAFDARLRQARRLRSDRKENQELKSHGIAVPKNRLARIAARLRLLARKFPKK